MLKIIPKQRDSYRTFLHGDDVFHKALRVYVKGGEKKFHVKNPAGEDYDLEYVENNSLLPDIPMMKGRVVLPPYLIYDENDSSKLYLKIFDGFDAVTFEDLNEYSIVLTKILLAHTQLDVYFSDERILWFVEPHERLKIVDELPEKTSANAFYVCARMCSGYAEGLRDQMSSEFLFHNVFVFQWLTDLPLDQVKYVEITVSYIVGIGGLLSGITRDEAAFASLGCKTFLQPKSTRFDYITERYFNIQTTPEECDETNTIYVSNSSPLAVTHFLNSFSADFHAEVLKDSFKQQMDEYLEASIGNKRALGVLIRGTDYISTKLTGTRQHATVNDMLPTIHQWMDEDGYDLIFLATEDQDILDQMRAEFGDKLRAIAQKRLRVSDLKDGQTISSYEEEHNQGDAYLEELEETTVNYFYALYILSQCESFMVSGQCNGWDVVNSFNQGKFRRAYKFQLGVTEK